ncbi:hypothetical protein K4F52_009408 [Lecanicillium sp. MT-2017a]|nr:hypothetical protein K4F52_009408 [Lecanicillium sp. MT-2017a]
MEGSSMASPTRALTLALLATILPFVGIANAQTFSDAVVGHAYPGISDECAEALNTTVTNCPAYLAWAAEEMPRLVPSALDALCTTACKSSLTSVRGDIASGCGGDSDVMEVDSVVYPATFVIDHYLYAYDVICAKDSDTGEYCDEIYLDALANGTAADSCSDCSLKIVKAQLNSPFGYDDDFAEGFQSVTSKCGATGYAFTSPADYAISTKSSPAATQAPTCGSPYVVQAGDSCDAIAMAKGASTYSVVKAGGTDPDCSNLQVGAELCLPEECELYRVQYDDTCQSILDSVTGLRASDLLAWNPNINVLCTNIDTMYEKLICISPPGRTLEDVTGIITTPTATQPPPTAVPRPSNAKAESNNRCAGWYEVQSGDYCQAISIRESISLKDFYYLNPSIDDPDCVNLWLDTAYCVRAVGDINTYSDYPYSTVPMYTLTSFSYFTTTMAMVETVEPIATPIVELPLAPGSQKEAEGCLEFVDYKDVVPEMDQSMQADVPDFTDNVNTCDFVSAEFGIYLDEFLSWNPSLEDLSPCMMQAGYRYCAGHEDAEEQPQQASKCLEIVTPYPGTVSDCSCFTNIAAYNAELSKLVEWNPWIGSASSCDEGIYADMTGTEERAVCVGVGGATTSGSTTVPTTPPPPPTTTTTSAGPPAPTRVGTVSGCRSYYVAVSGDGCYDIAAANDIALDDFYTWNPAVGDDCSGLWVDYAYCVQGPAGTTTSAPPTTTSTSGGVAHGRVE